MNWALALTLLRLALAPVVVALGLTRSGGAAVAVLLVAGFLSDVFDGVVARRTGTPTPNLRRLDSIVDTVFYLGIAAAAWMLHRTEIRPLLPLLLPAIVVGLLSHLENAAITLVLPEWRYDVRSLFVAWEIRQGHARAAG